MKYKGPYELAPDTEEDLVVNEKGGKKCNKNKPRMELLPPKPLLAAGEVVTFGAKKYGANNWKNVDISDFIGALERHIQEYKTGTRIDHDSGLRTTSHIVCNALFICQHDIDGKEFDPK